MVHPRVASVHRPAVRVALHNIGPIRDADVDLKPVTVLVGPNGSGKTLFSSIVYAASLASSQAVQRASFALMGPSGARPDDSVEDLLRRTVERWEDDMRTGFERELKRCCARDLATLGREHRTGYGAAPRITITDGDSEAPAWRLVFRLQNGKLVVERTNDAYVAPTPSLEGIDLSDRRRVRDRMFRALRRSLPGRAVYFPASRSGFMQTYGALTSLVWGALGSGYFEQATVGSIPGTAADFLQFLAQLRPEHDRGIGAEAATQIERSLLGGEISLVPGEGSPQVMFHPHDLSQTWPIEESATSTAELAPLALYLRHQARHVDAVFIDEPEAHLHPANQVALAACLGTIGNLLQSVVIATHSEFLVSELSNLTMESQLSLIEDSSSRPGSLQVYEFIRLPDKQGVDVRHLPIDPGRGFEVDQFASVADSTYRRSVELFNRIHS